MQAARASLAIALGPAQPALCGGVKRLLDFALAEGGNYPETRLDDVAPDPARDMVLVRVTGPRVEVQRLAYALRATFRWVEVDIEEA